MIKLFISYSRRNIITYSLAEWLRSNGYEIWIDVRNIHAGSVWPQEIVKAITECDIVVVIISEASTKSDWVEKELTLALSLKKPIVPLRIEDVPLPFIINVLQPIDYFAAPITAAASLLSTLSTKTKLPSIDKFVTLPVEAIQQPEQWLSMVEFRQWLLDHTLS